MGSGGECAWGFTKVRRHSTRPIWLIALLGVAWSDAHAQNFDGHGTNLPPDLADVADPVLGLGGAAMAAPTVSVTAEAATNLLVRRVFDGDDVNDVPILDDLFGLNLGASTQVYKNIGVGLSVPTWFVSDGLSAGGATFGDTSVWVPIRLHRNQGWRLGVSPFLQIPTGSEPRFLGEAGFSGGGLVSGGWSRGLLVLNLDVGMDATPRTSLDEWPGGAYARYASDVGFVPIERVGLHFETRSRIPVVSTAPSLPVEAMATVKVAATERINVTAATSTAVTRGVGAPGIRFLMGATVSPGKKPPVLDENVGLPPKDIHVIDVQGFPLTGVLVTVGPFDEETDGDGYATIPGRLALRSESLAISRKGYDEQTVPITGKEEFWEVTMERSPVPLAVSVVGPEGALAETEVRIEGPYDPGMPRIDEAGVRNWTVKPGAWRVVMASPGLGTQERTIIIEHDRSDPIRVDAVLASLVSEETKVVVRVVDRMGRPVEDAVVAIEDRDLGTTGTGGDLSVEGLGETAASFVVTSERYGASTAVDLQVLPGEQEVVAVLDWQPGSVQVEVTGPKGRPMDAAVTFVGPEVIPARDLGDDGEKLVHLTPGTWEVQIEAEGMGTQTRKVEITEEEGQLSVVKVALAKDEEGDGDVELRVVDVDGNAAANVPVMLDGKAVGETSSTGNLVLEGLDSGKKHTFTVGGDDLETTETQIQVVPGKQVEYATVSYADGVTDITVTDDNGVPINATVTVEGPDELAPVVTGLDGDARTTLPVGEWTLTIAAEGKAEQTRKITVDEGDKRLNTVQVRLEAEDEAAKATPKPAPSADPGAEAPAPRTVEVTVIDPEGYFVETADVFFDGESVGDPSNGVVLAGGVDEGKLEIAAEAPAMAAKAIEVEVDEEGQTEVILEMQWVPGALAVAVEGPDGEPIEATVTLKGPEDSLAPRTAVDGRAVVGASPGQWSVVVEAEGMKTAEIPVELSEEAELRELPVVMEAIPEGQAAMTFVAETPDGHALADADVVVDGEVVGKTSESGAFELYVAPREDHIVEIVPENRYETVVIPVDVPGSKRLDPQTKHTVVVEDKTRQVPILVEGTDGEPIVGEITAVGGRDLVAPVALDEDGVATLDLKPGNYLITATGADGSVATRQVEVLPDLGTKPAVVADVWSGGGGSEEAETTTDVVNIGDKTAAVVRMTVAPVRSQVVWGDRLQPPAPLWFDTGKADIRSKVDEMIDDLARWLLAHQEAAVVEIAGHTDDVGGVAYNQGLSEDRARAIEAGLVARGVAVERLLSRGYGLSRPVTAQTDAESRQRNRRAELVIVEWASDL